jgi:hypothetical protein
MVRTAAMENDKTPVGGSDGAPSFASSALVIDTVGYDIAVADGLLFWLAGDDWRRMFALDSHLRESMVRSAMTGLLALGVRLSFGDASLPSVPLDGAVQVAVLRDQLRRVRAVAPHALTEGSDALARILCTDRWARIYTPAVLDRPPSTPVRVVVGADLNHDLSLWRRMWELEQFTDLRALMLFGAPLGWLPLPVDLAAFPELRVLDLSRSSMRALPDTITEATALESIELGDNPLDLGALAPLWRLPSLRYVGLGGTEVTPAEAEALASRLPPGCHVEL